MILCRLHPIFYTIENSMGKKEGTEGYFSVEKILTLPPLKSSHISLSTHISVKRTKLHDLRLFLLHSLFQLNNNLFMFLALPRNYQTTQTYSTTTTMKKKMIHVLSPPPCNFTPTDENTVLPLIFLLIWM